MTLAAGIAKVSASTSGLAVSSSGIAFDDITLPLTPGIAWPCATEVAASDKKIATLLNFSLYFYSYRLYSVSSKE